MPCSPGTTVPSACSCCTCLTSAAATSGIQRRRCLRDAHKPKYPGERDAEKNLLNNIQHQEHPNTKNGTKSVFDVELRCYNSDIVCKPGESVDMDLLNENRSLVYAGKLLRHSATCFAWNEWTELFVFLFDNYLVLTQTKEVDGVTKYFVDHRPIPLDLLSLIDFLDPPTHRSEGILRFRNRQADCLPDNAADARFVYPCTIHYSGRLGGLYTLFTENLQTRAEWKRKLEEAIELRKVVQESNKVFEMEPLSTDTFFVPTTTAVPSWNHENSFTGKVTCSVPFTTADGKALVAIGCSEGVWVGFRHDSRSMRRVLHLKMVMHCAVLEDFGLFLVLADGVLLAYHLEALIPSSLQIAHTSQTGQTISGMHRVHFFSVGKQGSRTLVIYTREKRLDSIFCVLEPVVEKINVLTSKNGIRPVQFRLYREFFIPSKSIDLVFLRTRIAIFCPKGFEIMDLTDFTSVTIPVRDDCHKQLVKRCESSKPIGMFRVENEFLLCYDEFGVYVDKHGSPSRCTTIEWEDTADRVVMHWPYILLFHSRFIEVRHVVTGLLAQIILGSEIRCIWDGRGASSTGASMAPQPMKPDTRIHVVMSVPEQVGQTGQPGQSRARAQHVFELVPTVPCHPPPHSSSMPQNRRSGR